MGKIGRTWERFGYGKDLDTTVGSTLALSTTRTPLSRVLPLSPVCADEIELRTQRRGSVAIGCASAADTRGDVSPLLRSAPSLYLPTYMHAMATSRALVLCLFALAASPTSYLYPPPSQVITNLWRDEPCALRAWVRAEDLHQGSISHGTPNNVRPRSSY